MFGGHGGKQVQTGLRMRARRHRVATVEAEFGADPLAPGAAASTRSQSVSVIIPGSVKRSCPAEQTFGRAEAEPSQIVGGESDERVDPGRTGPVVTHALTR